MAETATHRVLLVRAGTTDWDNAGRLQGETDLPLSDSGRRELNEAIQRLGHPGLTMVLAANDEASRESGEMLAEAAAARLVTTADLREMAFGLWEGVLKAELEDRFCRAGKQWGENPSCVTPPEGEPFDAFAERLLGGLRRSISKVKGRGSRRSMTGPPAVGVVLRPVAEALVRCVWEGRPLSELRTVLKERPGPIWLEVNVEEEWTVPTRPTPTTTTHVRQTATAA